MEDSNVVVPWPTLPAPFLHISSAARQFCPAVPLRMLVRFALVLEVGLFPAAPQSWNKRPQAIIIPRKLSSVSNPVVLPNYARLASKISKEKNPGGPPNPPPAEL